MKLKVKGNQPVEPVLRFYLEADGDDVDLVVEDEAGETNILLSVTTDYSALPQVALHALGLGFEEKFDVNKENEVIVR